VIHTLPAAGGPVIPNFGGASTCVVQNGTFCTSWFTSHWGSTFQPALIQHIELTVIAVAIGFVIAFGLALVAHRFGKVASPVTFIGSLLYTIPSLTAFEILAPIFGINRVTVEIALVSYTLLVLFTNSLAGLSNVSPEIRDAAAGLGYTPLQTMLHVDIPLAVPYIFAGLRVAVVTIVSLATVAAYILPEGLGNLILLAENRSGFKTELIAAGALAILLALAFDFLLVGLQKLLSPPALLWIKRHLGFGFNVRTASGLTLEPTA
jgi:osmoprotectant transport system permease protein